MAFIRGLETLGKRDLAFAGGKGANLGVLIAAGLPVPGGFCVTTDAYRAFLAANHLEAEILRLSASANVDDPASLEAVSARIRALFENGDFPEGMVDEVKRAYAALGHPPRAVAVRSSATAEDLPELSFAGQQDTYLNVEGEQVLLQAIVRCWGSLWTARAIGYRRRNQIQEQDIALAVLVQQMVQSESSGVLFTANPMTGRRSETVIDATIGLGEALVSGQVEPDHYVVETASGRILSKTLGAKKCSIRGQVGGGTVTVDEDAADRQALADEHIVALTRLGQRAVACFGCPQDLEWTFSGGRLRIVQSRPITSLYPLPEGVSESPLEVLFSFGMWQGMLDPMTPLGRDLFSGVVSSLARRLGMRSSAATQRGFLVAGGRFFVNMTGLFRHPLGRRVLNVFIPAVDPASHTALQTLTRDPRLSMRKGGRKTLMPLLRLARFLALFPPNILYNLLSPARGRARISRKVDGAIVAVRRRVEPIADLPGLAVALEEISETFPGALLPVLLPAVIAGQIPFQLLLRLAPAIPEGPELVMALTRGLPHNVTTEMDLTLWETSRVIQADACARAHFSQTDAALIADQYRDGALPEVTQAALDGFLRTYGMRGVAEIDLGRPCWQDDPTYVVQVLKSYLQIDDSRRSPTAVFRRGAEEAGLARARLVASFRETRGGWLKARLVEGLSGRVRELTGLRETPKFAVIRIFGVFRDAFLKVGRQLAADGMLADAEDVFFLHAWESKGFSDETAARWRDVVVSRRQEYVREMRRRRVPRLMLSDGTTWYEGLEAPVGEDEECLAGTPVSPGVVEGVVHVVFDPRGVQLTPGEILVCPATDPAWTPLFLAAGGLVTEVGGMMTHGSVVAREYGIPAVVGVRQATTRLRSGQRVRLDGSSGRIVLLNEPS